MVAHIANKNANIDENTLILQRIFGILSLFESFTRCQMKNLGTAMVPRFFLLPQGFAGGDKMRPTVMRDRAGNGLGSAGIGWAGGKAQFPAAIHCPGIGRREGSEAPWG